MPSLGEELKRQREIREISLREIADATKISVRILEAIENNNYKILPGGVFNRNFIRAYAEFIGLDPEKTVRKYQQLLDPNGNHSEPAINADPASAQAVKPLKQYTVYIAMVVFLIAAFLVYFFWYHRV